MSKTPETTPASDESLRFRLRSIPSVESLLSAGSFEELAAEYGRPSLIEVTRTALDNLRCLVASGMSTENLEEAIGKLAETIQKNLDEQIAPSLRAAVNATGIIVHTNLGRAPLSKHALDSIARVATGYSNLELDLESGKRGSRHRHATKLLSTLFPGKGSLVVNNAAAAVMLSLNTFASGREVIISRGELVEIGGSFRIPEILERSGARLREVGTTNKTRLEDYRRAIGTETGALLRVHPSNFRIVGFTESVSTADLVKLGAEHGLTVIEDFGSGNMQPLDASGLKSEPTVFESLALDLDVCLFSCDKLLGGPQAGLLVGRPEAVETMKQNPMSRALRVDKLVYAALEATLSSFVRNRALTEIPVLRMISETQASVAARARTLAGRMGKACPELRFGTAEDHSRVGGGAAPDAIIPTVVITVSNDRLSADSILAALRRHQPPVIARISEDRVLLDLRTVTPEEELILEQALTSLSDI